MRKKRFQRMTQTGYHSYKGGKPHAKRELKKVQKKVPKEPEPLEGMALKVARSPVIAVIVVVR